MAVTMKDIAKHAGVGYGTVSNVLNKRNNVSIEKIMLVEEAARKLGYSINDSAKSLRGTDSNSIGLILPNISSNNYMNIYYNLKRLLNRYDFELKLYLTEYDFNIEEKSAQKCLELGHDFIIVSSCLKDPRKLYTLKYFSEKKIIFIDGKNNIDGENLFNVCFDKKYNLNHLFSYIKTNKCKDILLFSDLKDDFSYLKRSLECEDINVSSHFCNPFFNTPKSIEISSLKNDYDLIITSTIEKARTIKSFLNIKNKTYCNTKIIAYVSDDTMIYEDDIILFRNDYTELSNIVMEVIINKNYREQNQVVIIKNKGLVSKNDELNDKNEINLLLLSSPITDAIISIKPFIEKISNHKINIEQYDFADFNNIDFDNVLKKFDLIRVDVATLDIYGKKIFAKLDNKFEHLLNKFSGKFDDYMIIEDDYYCLPLDPSSQVMLYRKDMFENHKIKRIFYEKYRKDLNIPTDFKEYSLIENFFTHDVADISKGGSVCAGMPVTCANDLLARVDDYIETPIINNKIQLKKHQLIEAFELYKKSFVLNGSGANNFWSEVVSEFSNGETAMAITFSNHIGNIIKSGASKFTGEIGIANIPGDKPLIGGGVIGLSKYTEKKEECLRFLNVLYSDDVSFILTSLGGTIHNDKLLNDYRINYKFPWFDKINQNIKSKDKRMFQIDTDNLISTVDFETILGNAIRQALVHGADIDKMLDKAQLEINQKICK